MSCVHWLTGTAQAKVEGVHGELWQYKHYILISLLEVCLEVDRQQQVLRAVVEGGSYLVRSLVVRTSTLLLQILTT